MSKLAKGLRFRDTGRRIVVPGMPSVEAEQEITSLPMEQASIFRLELRIGTQAAISDLLSQSARTEFFHNVKRNLTRNIIEELFGEFREPINRVFDAIYKMDYREASDRLEALYKQMYEVEP